MCRRHGVTRMVTVALLMGSIAGCGGGAATTRSSAAPAPSPRRRRTSRPRQALSGARRRGSPSSCSRTRSTTRSSAVPARRISTRSRARAALAANYYAIAHPSLPNYLALTGGSTFGFSGSDCGTCSVSHRNLIDQLEAAGISWKVYAEGLPSPCSSAGDSGSLCPAPRSVYVLPRCGRQPCAVSVDRADHHAHARSGGTTPSPGSCGWFPISVTTCTHAVRIRAIVTCARWCHGYWPSSGRPVCCS